MAFLCLTRLCSPGQVLMATNRIDILDAALLRPGRIDRKIEFPNPSESSRFDILKIHSRKMNLMRGIDLRKIADRMPGAQLSPAAVVCRVRAALLRDDHTADNIYRANSPEMRCWSMKRSTLGDAETKDANECLAVEAWVTKGSRCAPLDAASVTVETGQAATLVYCGGDACRRRVRSGAEGVLHGGRHVCAAGAAGTRDAGGLRDGRCQGHEEGLRQEHVHQEALEVAPLHSLPYCVWSQCICFVVKVSCLVMPFTCQVRPLRSSSGRRQ